jgi:predicted DCC family thiol-disulfide oxidoreductase YuxK
MASAMTDHERVAGSVFYDGECSICVGGARRFGPLLARRRIDLVPLQSPDACKRLGIREAERLREMRLRLVDGTVFGGAAAVVEIARRIWWAWPLWALSRLPGAMRSLRAAYDWVARHRSCANGVCRIEEPAARRAAGVLPLIALPAMALLIRSSLPPWAFMWTMAGALYAGCKWLTYRDACTHGASPDRLRSLEYLVAWPGMDAAAFLSRADSESRLTVSEWMAAGLKTAFGAALIGISSRTALPAHPMLAGWLAMTGVVFVLHFGTFHLLSLLWRRFGVNAMPVMRNPLRSTSLTDFWGRRWNTAFHELATRFTFQPLRSRVGVSAAALLVFVLSGLIHELVISLPAHGGYGLPTGYFVVQGLGIAGERSGPGRRLGLGHGWRGWLFTVLVAAGPAYWLFHPPFVHRVILPMLAAIGGR